MLHLAGRVRLGVQVADLLQLQGALLGDRGAHPAADEQRALRVHARVRGRLDVGGVVQDALDLLGRVGKLAEQQANLVHAQLALRLGEQHGEKREADDLAQERLRRRDGDFLVRLRVDDAVGFARDGRAQHIGDAEHAGALDARVADGGERIGRLSRLRHGHDQRRRRDDRVAVAELACDLDHGGDARPALDELLGDQPRVV